MAKGDIIKLQTKIDAQHLVDASLVDTTNAENLVSSLDGESGAVELKTLNGESLIGPGAISINGAEWGNISGTLENQNDLATALADKASASVVDAHIGNSDIHVTTNDKSNWDAKAETSDIPTALSDLTSDATHRLVTDTEKNSWLSATVKYSMI